MVVLPINCTRSVPGHFVTNAIPGSTFGWISSLDRTSPPSGTV